MNFVFGLIIGLIVGWVIEWIIDWMFWRQGDKQLSQELAQAKAENHRLQTQLAEYEQRLQRLSQTEADLRACQASMADAEATIVQLRGSLSDLASRVPQREDPLERIHGIGEVFANRLREAGVHTFAQLAELTPHQIHEIIRPESWQKIEPDEWIAEARELAHEVAGASRGG